MITKLRLKNFQGHSDLTLALGPVTSIVGPTDAGKSSVVRALAHLFLNDLRGDYFVKDGEDRSDVLALVDCRKVRRSKGKARNTYHLDDITFKAFGVGGVPEPIAGLVNVSDINFQFQFDGPLWLADSPGQVSKKLNDIADLETMDRTLAAANARLRKEKDRSELLQEELKRLNEEETKLAWVPAAERHLAVAERANEIVKSCDVEIERIRALIGQHQHNDAAIQKIKDEANLLAPLAETMARIEKYDGRIARLSGLVKQLENCSTVTVPNVGRLKRLRAEADQVAEDCSILEGLLVEYKDLTKQVKAAGGEKAYLTTKVEKEYAGVCPTCGQPIKR